MRYLIQSISFLSQEACNAPEAPEGESPGARKGAASERHGTTLLSIIASQLGCTTEDIVDMELNVCDIQPGVIGGAHSEFVWAGRLDNLAMSYCSLAALIETTSNLQLEVRNEMSGHEK
jgi:aspartyl aminopeptidase